MLTHIQVRKMHMPLILFTDPQFTQSRNECADACLKECGFIYLQFLIFDAATAVIQCHALIAVQATCSRRPMAGCAIWTLACVAS
jgi:hypothetical protein